MKQEVGVGQTDFTVLTLIRDTSGNAKTGLTYTDIDIAYTRVETDNDVTTTDVSPADLATPALTDPHLDWGFLEVSAADHPGLYRLDIADAVFISGAWSSVVSIVGTGLEPSHLEFVLVPSPPYSGVDVYSVGGTTQTANDNGADINTLLTRIVGTLLAGNHTAQTGDSYTRIGAPAGASISADIAAAQSDLDAIIIDTAELQTDWTDGGRLDLLIDAILLDSGTTLDGKLDQLIAACITNAAGVDIAADIIALQSTADAIELDTGTDGVVVAAASKTGYRLSSTGVDDVHDEVVEGAVTFRQAIRLFLAALTGKSSGGGTTTLVFRDIGDTKDRLVVTVDANNNRTAVTTRDGS